MLNVVIGFDRQVRIPAYVVAESIMEHCKQPVNFTFLHRNNLPFFTRQRSPLDSTEFSVSRFLSPYLNDYRGWTLFVDNDVLINTDINELFSLTNDKYAVMCVKHNYIPKNIIKFNNNKQTAYSYKNWSSVMLFNNKLCTALTPEYVNSAPGLDLHQFKWLDQNLIGSLPEEWNYLVGSSSIDNPKLIHYTEGGPWYKETENCKYASDWLKVYQKITKIGV